MTPFEAGSQALCAAVRDMLPGPLGCASADPRLGHPLLPGEGLDGASPRRLTEFSAGRHAARLAMADLGIPARPLARGVDGMPDWPETLCGSITHSDEMCLAVVTPRRAGMTGLGVDLEPTTPLEAGTWRYVLSPDEIADLSQDAEAALAAKDLFVAKEAAFKAHYARFRRVMDFPSIRIAMVAGTFVASFDPRACGAQGPAAVHGRLRRVGGWSLSVATCA